MAVTSNVWNSLSLFFVCRLVSTWWNGKRLCRDLKSVLIEGAAWTKVGKFDVTVNECCERQVAVK